MEHKDIAKLSELSRIRITEDEGDVLAEKIHSIIDYVDRLKDVSGHIDASTDQEIGLVYNRMREDAVSASDEERELIRKNFPETEAGYLAVKKVLKN